MLKLGLIWCLALASVGVVYGAGCTDAKAAYDCADICNKYKDCFDSNYDTDKCASQCRANADDDAFADKASACQNCEDDATCVQAAFTCADECVGIVP